MSTSSPLLLHLGIKSKNTNAIITNNRTPAIDIQTIFLAEDFFLPEFESSEAVGPLACFPGVCWEGGARETNGGPETGRPPKNGGARGGVITEDVGRGDGATVEVNRFPSFLQVYLNVSYESINHK